MAAVSNSQYSTYSTEGVYIIQVQIEEKTGLLEASKTHLYGPRSGLIEF